MFYSHETANMAWPLSATIGRRGATKAVTRKAIQAVQINKACKKILDPGAPLALRLQGNLLYGVSRIYSEQCRYILDDAERVRATMRKVYRQFGEFDDVTDPKAGKAAHGQNLIPDDPHFDIENFQINLPEVDKLEALLRGHDNLSQTSLGYSQFSPADIALSAGSSSDRHSLGFDFLNSAQSSQKYATPLNLPSDANKSFDQRLRTLEDESLMLNEDLSFSFDEDGNLIEPGDDPVLPPLLGIDGQLPPAPQQAQVGVGEHASQFGSGIVGLDDEFLVMDDYPLPDAQALQPQGPQPNQQDVYDTEAPELGTRPRRRRARKAKVGAFVDRQGETVVNKAVLRQWGDEYVQRSEEAVYAKSNTAPVKARANAFVFTFGVGIASVGQTVSQMGVKHPLADVFAGIALRDAILGVPILDDPQPNSVRAKGRRRSASDAFDDEVEDKNEDETGRRVKQRLDDDDGALNIDEDIQDDEAGRRARQRMNEDDDMLNLGDDIQDDEVGRRDSKALPEHPSSTGMPWSRQGSLIPGSAVKDSGQRRGRHVTSSPVVSRGGSRIPSDIERYSDVNVPRSDNFELPEYDAPLAGLGRSSSSGPHLPGIEGEGEGDSHAAVDKAGDDFYEYIVEKALADGVDDLSEDKDKDESANTDSNGDSSVGGGGGGGKEKIRWVPFDALADPTRHGKDVAAQAFYHTLSLATKSKVRVKQEGGMWQAFGRIRIGVDVSEDVDIGVEGLKLGGGSDVEEEQQEDDDGDILMEADLDF